MVNLFQNISEKNKQKILRSLESHTFSFAKGVNILPTLYGDDIICFIESGSIQIANVDYNGNKNIVDELFEEEVFGSNISYIMNENYQVLTKEPCIITVIEYDRVVDSENVKYDYYITFLKNLLKIVNEKTLERNERIEILSKKTIRDKLLEYFRISSKRVGSSTIYLPFSFTDLASYLGVDRSAMSREIKYLKEEGFITVNGRRIKLNIYVK